MGWDMHFRLKAFSLHLLSSATVLTTILGSLYFGWYRWPGWYLTDVTTVVLVMVCVDVVLGPTLTLIIAAVPLLLVASRGQVWGWGAPASAACYAIGTLGVAGFLLAERRAGDSALLRQAFEARQEHCNFMPGEVVAGRDMAE